MVLTCNGVELAALDITLDRALIEERSYHVDTTLIANKNHLIRQVFGANM